MNTRLKIGSDTCLLLCEPIIYTSGLRSDIVNWFNIIIV